MKSKFLGLFRSTPTPSSDPTQEIARARQLHQQGELATAGTLYEDILGRHPDSADAHYRYGNLLKDQGSLAQALSSYDKAIALQADHAHAFCNRAVVLGLMKRLPEALASYDRAIAIDPADAIAHCNRAMLLLAMGDKDAALTGFEAAIRLDPGNFPAHFARGTLLQERKRWQEALAAYDRAVAIKPDDAPLHYNRGTVLKELKRLPEAVTSYGKAIASNPRFALAHANRATLLQELHQLPAALKDYDRALELDEGNANTHANRAVLLQLMRQPKQALAGYDRAVALDPACADAWFGRGAVLCEMDDLDASADSYRHALQIRPDFGDAHVNLGVTLQNMGRLREAIASYRRGIACIPTLPEAHYNLALAALTEGDYATGWAEYEWRWQAKGGPIFREKRTFAQPLWLGKEPIAGRTILLYGEQGLGDSLQFCRYVERVAQQGARVILEVPRPLVPVCAHLPGVSQVIAYGTPLPEFDVQCPLMSLPLVFTTTLDNIPSPAGYLRSDPAKVAAWRDRLGVKVKPRIGLTWSGNQTAGTNRKRHFALAGLAPHLSAHFDYYCLQTDVVDADQETLSNTAGIFQFRNALQDFSDTAALCECMDLVISVDTSVAHLSCALGKSTWVLLAYAADWRWLTDREDSPWYRAARLFRQSSPGDWNGVFERVAAALQAEANP